MQYTEDVNNIAIGEDRKLKLKESDTVIVASPIVPGTEKEAANMENDLYKAGVKVYHKKFGEGIITEIAPNITPAIGHTIHEISHLFVI